MDSLTKLRRQKRNVETRVTNENKDKLINQINKSASDYGYSKLSKNASIKEVTNFKNQYKERLTYDIVTLSIQQGKSIIAEIEGRELKKSDDFQTKRLGEFAKDLADAKKKSDKKLTPDEKNFIERGNNNIKGYGNLDVMTLFENTKNDKQRKDLINEIKNQDAKEIFYDKQTEIFEKTFQKVGIVREKDINKIKDKLRNMEMKDVINQTNDLIQTIEVFDYKKFEKEGSDETEIANARVDDVLIKMGISNKGSKKVKNIKKKYKKDFAENTGFIYE